jgi:hypothetical protein
MDAVDVAPLRNSKGIVKHLSSWSVPSNESPYVIMAGSAVKLLSHMKGKR